MKKIGVDIVPNHADFSMITSSVLKAFLQFQETNLFIRATFPIVGFPSCVVYFDRPDRVTGKTKYPFWKMFEFAVDGITSFGVVPLRICSMVGLLFLYWHYSCCSGVLLSKFLEVQFQVGLPRLPLFTCLVEYSCFFLGSLVSTWVKSILKSKSFRVISFRKRSTLLRKMLLFERPLKSFKKLS